MSMAFLGPIASMASYTDDTEPFDEGDGKLKRMSESGVSESCVQTMKQTWVLLGVQHAHCETFGTKNSLAWLRALALAP